MRDRLQSLYPPRSNIFSVSKKKGCARAHPQPQQRDVKTLTQCTGHIAHRAGGRRETGTLTKLRRQYGFTAGRFLDLGQ